MFGDEKPTPILQPEKMIYLLRALSIISGTKIDVRNVITRGRYADLVTACHLITRNKQFPCPFVLSPILESIQIGHGKSFGPGGVVACM
jgi:hypothetical protein